MTFFVATAFFLSTILSGIQTPDEDAAPDVPTCLGVVLPAVEGVEGSATDFGIALRDLFASYLRGPAIEPLALEARLPPQAMEEARQKGCGLVLTASLTRTRGKGLWRKIGQAAGSAAWYVPYSGGLGAAAAAAGAQAAASLATNTRAKDEMRLEYQVTTLGGFETVPMTTDRAKARSDGEDLLTPLVARAAETVVGAVVTR